MIPALVIDVAGEAFTVDDAQTLLRVLREEAAVLPDGVSVASHEAGPDGRPRLGGRRLRREKCQDLAERLEVVLAELQLAPGR